MNESYVIGENENNAQGFCAVRRTPTSLFPRKKIDYRITDTIFPFFFFFFFFLRARLFISSFFRWKVEACRWALGKKMLWEENKIIVGIFTSLLRTLEQITIVCLLNSPHALLECGYGFLYDSRVTWLCETNFGVPMGSGGSKAPGNALGLSLENFICIQKNEVSRGSITRRIILRGHSPSKKTVSSLVMPKIIDVHDFRMKIFNIIFFVFENDFIIIIPAWKNIICFCLVSPHFVQLILLQSAAECLKCRFIFHGWSKRSILYCTCRVGYILIPQELKLRGFYPSLWSKRYTNLAYLGSKLVLGSNNKF